MIEIEMKEFTVGIVKKVNLGNYETKDFSLTATYQVEYAGEYKKDDVSALINKVKVQIDDEIKDWIQTTLNERFSQK